MSSSIPRESADRSNAEFDDVAKDLFPYTIVAPEEYAARNAHLWLCFSLHLYRYGDPVLGAWVRRLGEILFDEAEVERCRQQFLTPEEFAKVQKQRTEDDF
jgi:hypothetical protein